MKKSLKQLGIMFLATLMVACLASAASAINIVGVVTDNENVDYLGIYSVDSNDDKFWHNDWTGSAEKNTPPYIITYELAEPTEIQSIGILPRIDGNSNGMIYHFIIKVSDDGVNFTAAQEIDSFSSSFVTQTATLDTPVTAKFIQLEVLESEGTTYCSLNQLYINGEAAIYDPASAAVPEEPEAPTDPETPEEPETPAETDASETVDSEAATAPQTGDAMAIMAAVIAVVSGSGVVAMRKRRN